MRSGGFLTKQREEEELVLGSSQSSMSRYDRALSPSWSFQNVIPGLPSFGYLLRGLQHRDARRRSTVSAAHHLFGPVDTRMQCSKC